MATNLTHKAPRLTAAQWRVLAALAEGCEPGRLVGRVLDRLDAAGFVSTVWDTNHSGHSEITPAGRAALAATKGQS